MVCTGSTLPNSRLLSKVDETRLYLSAERKVIPAKGKALIDTQLSIAVPPGTYGRVAPRSGLGTSIQDTFMGISRAHIYWIVFPASKYMIDTGAGVIDADYRGVVFVLLFNLSDSEFESTCLR